METVVCRYWSDLNLHLFCAEVHLQYTQKLNVWAGILGNDIVGSLFIFANSTGEVHVDMLENTIEPLITEIIADDYNRNVFTFNRME